MKTTLLICLTSVALALCVDAQTPTPAPAGPSPAASVSPVAATSPSATVTAASVTPASTPDDDNAIERAVKRNVRKHLNMTVGSHKDHDTDGINGDSADMAIAIVGIVFMTLFGAPVLMVAAIMLFSYLKARSLHRTVRMMVEKGQEVPASLFAPPPVVRARSDMRRGVVLTMIGFGLIIFLAAVNDGFRGGEWTIGVIPLMIGFGYLLVWKLDVRKNGPPPAPLL